MVFESYVVDILNRFLGQYVKNLDSSQLKIGIWGGDVKLENLELKESALDDLDLPVKVLRGNLGRLVLKIPWKNLYSEAVVASIEGVYLLVRPNEGLKYNAEKEEHAKQEKKKRQLEAIEEARKREEEKNKAPKDEKSDSFTEKLAMHIIKNIQVSIEDIHVRYEDNVTTPSAPFSIGISLENLSMQSTDENWKPCLVKDAVQIVNKLVRLDSLALYWNTRDNIGEVPSGEQWLNMAKSGVATRRTAKHFTPNNFRYILEPISAVTKMKLNLKPGTDLDIPKALVNIILEEIGLVLARKQYQDLMELVEGFDRMATNSAFRKYKPDVPLHGNAKKWWKYAMSSILEEDVREKNENVVLETHQATQGFM